MKRRNPLLVTEPVKLILEKCIGIGFVLLVVLAPLTLLLLLLRRLRRADGQPPRTGMAAGVIAAGVTAALVDALLIEPNILSVTRVMLPMAALPPGKKLRIVHLSDLHIVKPRAFYRRVIRGVAAESPNLILITGDLLQESPSPRQWAFAEGVFGQLARIAPTVMIPGGHDKFPIPTAPEWTLLRNEACDMEIRGVPVHLIGWDDFNRDPDWQPPALDVVPGRVNIVLTHSPDWFDHAAALGADLALAGHTHGGQVRLPLWGAVITASHTGKRFEYGRYRLGTMWAFVTRGIAQSPWPTPPMRFLCPPEIVVLTLTHEA